MTEREDSLAIHRERMGQLRRGRAISAKRGNEAAVAQYDAEIERVTRIGKRIKSPINQPPQTGEMNDVRS